MEETIVVVDSDLVEKSYAHTEQSRISATGSPSREYWTIKELTELKTMYLDKGWKIKSYQISSGAGITVVHLVKGEA